MLAHWELVRDNPPLSAATCESVLEATAVDAAANAVPRQAEDTDDVGQPGGHTEEARSVAAAHKANNAVGAAQRQSARDRQATSARAAPASGADICCMLVAWEWKGTSPARGQPSFGEIAHHVKSLLGVGSGVTSLVAYLGQEHVDYVHGDAFMGIHVSPVSEVLKLTENPRRKIRR